MSMGDWRSLYKKKLRTAEEAVRVIPNDSRVLLGHAVGEPRKLVDALVENYEQYTDVEICHWVPMGDGLYTQPGMEGHLRHNALFVGASTRQGVRENRADYTPIFFHETPKLMRDGTLPIDVAMVSLSSPDEDGYCSFGVSVCATKPGALSAKLIIAEINDCMPRTGGDSLIHVSQLSYVVETSYPLPELAGGTVTEVECKIGENCASLIEDGSTLQLGIGSIPDAVLLYLRDKKDLGIHSEMISDGVVDLYRAGVITGAKKTIHQGKIVVGFLMGTKKLYDFVDNNSVVEMRQIDYVNDPVTISQNYRMVSINSCLQVDFTGQVNSESMGTVQFSGIGGQVDYVRGAAMCEGGKSILAMPSTAAKGTISRIVPCLDYGAAVSTSRNDVHYIVTEYGVANLKGKSLRARAAALIEIAHPDFREALWQAFGQRFGEVERL